MKPTAGVAGTVQGGIGEIFGESFTQEHALFPVACIYLKAQKSSLLP
jgi:hypothetical protein